jgi:hypothetical protein
VVLLVLAVIWGALLISWLRSRSVSTFSDSVGTFRRHLNVLERTTPTTVRPANRMRDTYAAPAFRAGPIRGQRIEAIGLATPRISAVPVARRVPTSSSATAFRRRQAQKRRRDVFFALLAGAIGSFLIAVIGVTVLWPVQVLFDVMLVAYCALLVRIRNLAAERELKLRFMPVVPVMPVTPGERRPVRRPRPAYDLAAGYGDLELRRAAN